MSKAGAETVAVMNLLVCTCHINFLEYITNVLSRLDSNSSQSLTPIKWAEKQAAKAIIAANMDLELRLVPDSARFGPLVAGF